MSSYYGSATKPAPRSSNHLALPPAHHHQGKARHPQGNLDLPSQTVVSIRILFQKIYHYLFQEGKSELSRRSADPSSNLGAEPATSKSPSLERLKILTDPQLLELVTDLCDEIDRREPETRGEPCAQPFLPPQDFPDSRNQSRQKLATLRTAWFRSLITDVWTEIRRRHREFMRDEAELDRTTSDEQQKGNDDEEEEHTLVDDADASSFAPAPPPKDLGARLAPVHPKSESWDGGTEAMYTEVGTDYGTEAYAPPSRQGSHRSSLAKPAWLLDAEQAVQNHLGPGRSSHDFLHADRTRRAALFIARQIRQRHKIDLVVVELSSLFISACNDPKHPVREPKEFVGPWCQKHRNVVTSVQAELITRICRTVSVKKEERRRREKRETDWHRSCLELHAIQDADKLEQLGCIGILRTAASYGTSHKPLFDCSDASQALASIRPGNSVSHFLEKERILALLRTSEGRQLAERRYARMQQFAQDLADEFSFEDGL